MKSLNSLLLLIILILTNFSGFSQQVERDANYHFKSQSYAVALKLYQNLQKTDTINTLYNYRLGVCYLNTNHEPWEALTYFLKGESQYMDDAQFAFELGKAYLYNYQFDKSIESFQKALSLEKKNKDFINSINQWIQMVKNASDLVKHPLDISFINLGSKFNSEMDDLTPIISPDGELLFFTSNQQYDTKYKLYTNNVYYSNADDGDFTKSKKLSSVSSIDDEFVAGFSLANDKLFVQLAGYEAFQDIMFSDRVGAGFRGKNMLNVSVNSRSGEFAAFESTDGDTLYFSSNRPGGFGGTDIYYSLKLPTGEWGEPRNCGNIINSAFNEDFPVLADNGSILYFCSDNPKSMGGFDIFKTKIDPSSRNFSDPKNLGYPLNDVFDNKTIAFAPNKRYAYVSALRPNGVGFADIYRVVFNQEDPSVKILTIRLKTGSVDSLGDLTTIDSTIQLTAYTKSKVLFGKYTYDFTNKQATIALPPGNYSIELTGNTIEPDEFKISIPDIPIGSKFEKKEWLIKLRN